MIYFMQRRKAVLVTLFIATGLVGIIFLFFGADAEINRANVKFLADYGWQVEETPMELVHLTIPREVDAVYEAYHTLNQNAGFNLSACRGMKVTRYSYRVLNHAQGKNGGVRANVFVAQDTIVAADISSLEEEGFVRSVDDATDQIPTEKEEQANIE